MVYGAYFLNWNNIFKFASVNALFKSLQYNTYTEGID